MITVKFKRLSDKAVMPTKATTGSAGFDLTCSRITTELNECGQVILVYHTDLALEIPEGYEGQLRNRSSISKKSMRLSTGMSTIDSDYRGEITAKFVVTTDVVPAIFKEGERFAQLVIHKTEDIAFVESEGLSETARGEGGYGSTGNKTTSNKDEYSAATGSDQDSQKETSPAGDDQTETVPAAEENASEQAQ